MSDGVPAPAPHATLRHHWIVRVTHWVAVVAILIMAGSGLRIFDAYPAFHRRGETFCCYPFEGHPIPAWLTFGGWLAGARNWHFAMMWVLAISPDDKLLATSSDQGFIYLWDFATGNKIKEWHFPFPVQQVAFAPDARHLAVANGNGTVFILRLNKGPAPLSK